MPNRDRLVWNHGGSGDDVIAAAPGHVVSVLSPTSRYTEPFLRHLAGQAPQAPLWLVPGRRSFGRQVIAGAAETAKTLGLRTVRIGPADELPADHTPGAWDLFCAGSFEEGVARVTTARALARQLRLIGAVAAGVRDFGREVTSAEGVYGIAQWFPGRRTTIELGPSEEDFLQAYSALTGAVPLIIRLFRRQPRPCSPHTAPEPLATWRGRAWGPWRPRCGQPRCSAPLESIRPAEHSSATRRHWCAGPSTARRRYPHYATHPPKERGPDHLRFATWETRVSYTVRLPITPREKTRPDRHRLMSRCSPPSTRHSSVRIAAS